MKSLVKVRPMLSVLQKANSNLHKAIIKNCDDQTIQTLTNIVHNVLVGNVPLDEKIFRKLKRYKSCLRKLHRNIRKNSSVKYRRKQLIQTGGFLPLILGSLLSGALAYGGEKLAEYGTKKISEVVPLPIVVCHTTVVWIRIRRMHYEKFIY